jgi:acyl phosphate:glycerol-3-phosphate acyltransferase
MMNAILLITAYLIGNFSPAFFLGKIMAGIDIREHGSGNAGTTNVIRVLGTKAGIAVLVMDILKGALAVYLGRRVGSEGLAVFAGVMVVAGHNWPVLMKFKGGKGAATTVGVGLALNAPFTLFCFALGLIIVAATKYVSLASISVMPVWTIMVLIWGSESMHVYLGIILSLLSLYQHRRNIIRLINGSENKISFKKK